MKSTLLIIPCFNEEKRFGIEYWKKICNELEMVDFVFVDDGSTDKTLTILNIFAMSTKCLVESNEKNLGKARTVTKMLHKYSYEKYEILGFIDSDGAYEIEDIKRIVIKAKRLLTSGDFEGLFSSRINLAGRLIERKKFRHYISRTIYTILNIKFRVQLYDTQSGYKLFLNSSEWQEVFNFQPKTRWFIDIEFLLRFKILYKRNPRIWEEPLIFWKKIANSKIRISSFKNILVDFYNLFRYY